MTRIAVLSDLHFGFDRRALIEPLLERVNTSRADLVVVSGDLTQRAKPDQFARAAAFLNRLDAPWLATPGNHDIPLFNPFLRLLNPYGRYRNHIAPDLWPAARVGQVQVLSLNSVDPLAHQRGVVRDEQLRRVLDQIDPDMMNLIILHHPLQHRPGVDKELAKGAARALAALTRAGAQIVVTGHLHVWSAGALPLPDRIGPLLQIQTGTALCARPADLRNEFCVLDIDGPRLLIERHVAPMVEHGFHPPELVRFSRASGRWVALDHDPGREAEPLPTDPEATETAFSTANRS